MELCNIFDTHAHYDDERFDEDRDALLPQLHEQGVALILNAGCDMKSSYTTVEYTQRYDFVYGAVGVHPHSAKEAAGTGYLEELARLAKENEKIRAIGEIGLDYHYDFSPRDTQKQVFAQQLELAKQLDLPVIIHDREAHGDTLELLQNYRPKGIVHCFSGSAEFAKEILRLGMYIGFTGALTFKNARRAVEAVGDIPLNRLLLETDCPYMAPEPYRGKRCDSRMIARTAQVMASIKGIDAQQMVDIACQNGMEAYGISR